MWYMGSQDPKQRLLDKVIDHLATHGLGDLSLRQLAAAIGTSHRMLNYHFGSRSGLLVEVVREVERRQQQRFNDFLRELESHARSTTQTPLFPEIAWRWWQHISDPHLWPHERLFFEIYGQALTGHPELAGFLTRVVESWLDPLIRFARAYGIPEPEARTEARLALAVTRGLLLDLLATGDRAGVDAAMKRQIAHYVTNHTNSAGVDVTKTT